MTAGELVQTLGSSPAVVTAATKTLVACGFVQRTHLGRDMRCVHFMASDEGVSTLEHVDEALTQLVRELWRGMDEGLATFSLSGTTRIDDARKPELPRTGSRFVTLFFETYYLSKRVVMDALEPFGITLSAYRALREVGTEGPLRFKVLTSRLLMRPNTLTAAASELESRGLAGRAESEGDLRSFTLVPTNDGRAFLAGATTAVELAMSSAPYETTPEERRAFNAQAECIMRNIMRDGLLV